MSNERPLPRLAFVYVVVISAITLLMFVLSFPASIGVLLWLFPGILLYFSYFMLFMNALHTVSLVRSTFDRGAGLNSV